MNQGLLKIDFLLFRSFYHSGLSGWESSFALEQAVGACESHLYQKEGLEAGVKQLLMELFFGLLGLRVSPSTLSRS